MIYSTPAVKATPSFPTHHGVLPIKPAHLQYVVWRERLVSPSAPLLVPGLGAISAGLDMALITGAAYLDSRSTQQVDFYTAKLHYRIHDLMHLQADRLYVSDYGAELFSRFLEQLMRDDLNDRVLRGKQQGRLEKNTIESFLDETGLNEWFEFDSEKKAQWRLRKHRGLPNIRGHNLMRAMAS